MSPERHRILLDQMLKVQLAECLQTEGHDVVRVSEVGQSRASDADILKTAVETGRVLVTLDDDFGNWAVLPLDRHPGVVRIKVHPPSTERLAELLLPVLATHPPEDFANHLVILASGRVKWIRTGRPAPPTG